MEASNQTNDQALPTYVAPLDPVYNANDRLESPPAYTPAPQMTPTPQSSSGINANQVECCCWGLYCLCCCLDIAVRAATI